MARASGHQNSRHALVFLMSLFLLAALPVTSFGKHRDRRSRRDFNDWKCGKFVNCHDARDGRWDGLGRRRSISIWDRRGNWPDDNWRTRNWDNRGWATRSNDRRRWNNWDDNRRRRRTTYVRNSRWYR